MRQKKRKRSGLSLLTAFLFALILVAVGWGILSLAAKLTHYGANTAISSREEPEPAEEKLPEAPVPEDTLPVNRYEREGFYEEKGLRYYAGTDGTSGVPGIDVSAHQTEIQWDQVREAGVEFAMIRVGYRGYGSGKLDLDDYFLANMEGALAAGLDVGVYFFSQALTPEEAVEEAEYVLNWINGYEIACPVVFDWEEVQQKARTDEMNMLLLTACAEAFCRTIEAAGYRAAVYFNQVYGYEQYNLHSLEAYEFWLAEYADAPTFYYDFHMWQYTNSGTVAGINGPVDLNIYFRRP